jgi:hypothetical protein
MNDNINWDNVLESLKTRIGRMDIMGMSENSIREYLACNQPGPDIYNYSGFLFKELLCFTYEIIQVIVF